MARHDEGFFSAKDNLRLFWESTSPDDEASVRAHVAVVHGYADHCGRYRKTIERLVGDGFAVHAFDYRGHGQADGRRGHCDSFSDFVDDLELFWNRVLKAASGKPAFLLAHSHGGLMAIHFLRRRPAGLKGMVLSAPYLELGVKAPALQVLAARAVAVIAPWFSQKNPLTPAHLTRDVAEQKLVANDPLYNRTLTVGWFVASQRAQAEAVAMAGEISLPLFVFVGENDGVARPEATRAFFERVASADKRFKEYPGMLHECLNEVGREQVWADISSWISAHS